MLRLLTTMFTERYRHHCQRSRNNALLASFCYQPESHAGNGPDKPHGDDACFQDHGAKYDGFKGRSVVHSFMLDCGRLWLLSQC